MDNRSLHNHDLERITHCRTTIGIDYFNSVVMGPVGSNLLRIVIQVVSVRSTRVVQESTIPIPIVGIGLNKVLFTIQPCIKLDMFILANIRATSNGKNRISYDHNSVRDTSVGVFTSRNVKNDSSTINILGCVTHYCCRAFTEPRATQERMFETVSEPFIGKQRGVNAITVEVADRNSHINLTTITNLVGIGSHIQSSNIEHFKRCTRPYIDRVEAPCHTT